VNDRVNFFAKYWQRNGLNGSFQPFSTAGRFMVKLKLGHEYEGHRLDWLPGGGK